MKKHALIAATAFVLVVAITTAVTHLPIGKRDEYPQENEAGRSAPRKAERPKSTPSESRDKLAGVGEKGAWERISPARAEAVTVDEFNSVRGRWVEQMQEQHRETLEKDIEVRLALMRERLGLSDVQAALVERLLVEHLEERLPKIGSDGELVIKPKGANADDPQDAKLNALLDKLLSGEQKKAYARFREQLLREEVEMRANKRLADLQTCLDLSEEQADKVFAVLRGEELARGHSPQLIRGGYKDFIDAGGTTAGWREHRDQMATLERKWKLDQLRGILNQPQLDAYRTFLELRRQRNINLVQGRSLRVDVFPSGK